MVPFIGTRSLQLPENMPKLTDYSSTNKKESGDRGFVLLLNFKLSAQITQQSRSQKDVYPMSPQECKWM